MTFRTEFATTVTDGKTYVSLFDGETTAAVASLTIQPENKRLESDRQTDPKGSQQKDKTTMKKTLSIIGLTLALVASASAQTTVNTNSGTPVLSGPGVDFINSLTTWTNWGVAGGMIYAPQGRVDSAGKVHSTYGAFVTALYNITPWLASGIGLDYLDSNVTMPSFQTQIQVPFTIAGSVTVTPFGFAGVYTPISGREGDNGNAGGLFGAGLAVNIVSGLKAVYAIENRTNERGPWHLFGLAYSKAF
jgi:hypothetical protein